MHKGGEQVWGYMGEQMAYSGQTLAPRRSRSLDQCDGPALVARRMLRVQPRKILPQAVTFVCAHPVQTTLFVSSTFLSVSCA